MSARRGDHHTTGGLDRANSGHTDRGWRSDKKSGRYSPYAVRGGHRRVPGRRRRIALLTAAALGVVALAIWLVPRLFPSDRPAFDGAAALAHVEAQTALGPRVPGTDAHAAFRELALEHFSPLAAAAAEQTFAYRDRVDTARVWTGYNLVAAFQPQMGRRVMLAAHYDSRPTADQDPDPARRSEPVMGANDGASGVAVLMELARIFYATPPPVGVDLVLFDLEDMGTGENQDSTDVGALGQDASGSNPYAIGSEFFAQQNATYRPAYGVLLDMVCAPDARFPVEGPLAPLRLQRGGPRVGRRRAGGRHAALHARGRRRRRGRPHRVSAPRHPRRQCHPAAVP